MRFCLLGLALIAFAQPGAAHEKHRHHARHHLHHPRLAPDLDNAELPLVTEPVRMRRHHEEIDGELDAMIRRHAAANGLPPDLVRHVVRKESNFNPRASNRGALGLMQITHATARSLGYSGSAEGLYDPETNLTYAVRYLAGAYRTAGGSQTLRVGVLSLRISPPRRHPLRRRASGRARRSPSGEAGRGAGDPCPPSRVAGSRTPARREGRHGGNADGQGCGRGAGTEDCG